MPRSGCYQVFRANVNEQMARNDESVAKLITVFVILANLMQYSPGFLCYGPQ